MKVGGGREKEREREREREREKHTGGGGGGLETYSRYKDLSGIVVIIQN